MRTPGSGLTRSPPGRHRRPRGRFRRTSTPARSATGGAGAPGGARARPVGAWPLLRTSVPRLLLNSVGPIGGFWLGDTLTGIAGGVLLATVASLGLFGWERRKGRPGRLARLSLAIVLLQVTAGLLAGSAVLYFLPSVSVDLVEGSAFGISCLTRLPLAGVLAAELLPLPPAASHPPALRQLFVRLSLVWGIYFTCRGAISLTVLLTASTHTYLLVRSLLDAPLVLLLAAGSVRYGIRRLGTIPPVAEARPSVRTDRQEVLV